MSEQTKPDTPSPEQQAIWREEKRKLARTQGIGLGVGMGAVVGTAVGIVINNLILGVILGMVLGFFLGFYIIARDLRGKG